MSEPMSEPKLDDTRVRLPHTELEVGRIGLGSSFGIGPDDVEYAFDHGINYFYWGSIRRPGFGNGIKRLSKHSRDQMVVALQSYARWPGMLLQSTFDMGLRRLGLDYADILILGWFNHRPPQGIIDAALELKEKGRVRYLLMSGHQRSFFPEMAKENLFDLFMVRYNAAHRGAERDVFPLLPGGDEHPGVCAYTATRWGSLIDAGKMSAGERTPTAGDCYRFCLTSPHVDMVLCGPENSEHVRQAVRAMQAGALDEEELAWMRRIGDHVYGRSPFTSLVD
jgi:aryl-alcohol dehydrogenase-like predicted oxidoreductase